MGKEQSHSEPFNHYRNHLGRIRDQITKAVRDPYLAALLNERQSMITSRMYDVIPVRGFVDPFLEKQMRTDTWTITPEVEAELPPQAIAKLRESFDKRSEVLWPWLLFDKDHERLYKDFMTNYLLAAQMIGSFPFNPTFEAVGHQRDIDWKHRLLAAQLIFMRSCINTPEITVAATPILSMIGAAKNAYSGQDIPTLQEMVKKKAPKLQNDTHNPFIHFGMWDNHDDLLMMCTDRALRDIVLMYYGLFRDVRLPETSGYLVGQTVNVLAPNAHQSILRVAN